MKVTVTQYAQVATIDGQSEGRIEGIYVFHFVDLSLVSISFVSEEMDGTNLLNINCEDHVDIQIGDKVSYFYVGMTEPTYLQRMGKLTDSEPQPFSSHSIGE